MVNLTTWSTEMRQVTRHYWVFHACHLATFWNCMLLFGYVWCGPHDEIVLVQSSWLFCVTFFVTHRLPYCINSNHKLATHICSWILDRLQTRDLTPVTKPQHIFWFMVCLQLLAKVKNNQQSPDWSCTTTSMNGS